MFTSKLFLAAALKLLLLSCLSTFGNPFPADLGIEGGDEVTAPFGSCQTYKLGRDDGDLFTEPHILNDGSELAFYSFKDEDVMLYLQLRLPDAMFKVKIEGTMVTLEKCDKYLRTGCEVMAQEGVKTSDHIIPQHWNTVVVGLDKNELKIHVGNRMVKSMSMRDYTDIQDATWSVHLDNERKTKGNASSQYSTEYLVQFKCKEFVPPATTRPSETDTDSPFETTSTHSHGTAAPITEEEKTSSDNSLVGIIVGVVVAVIILIAVAIILYNVLKNRRSADISETAPMQMAK